MVTARSLPAAQRVLQPVRSRGVLRGFGNLLGKEYGLWWNTSRWLVHLLLWPVLLNGLVVIAAVTLGREPSFTAFEISQMVTTLFFLTMAQAGAFGGMVATQGAIVGEKQRGTVAWILSKPVRRDVFVLAKLVAHAVSFLTLAVVIPSAIFYGQSRLLWGSFPNPVTFSAAVLLAMVHVLFYLALTLMLGTLFRSSGPVAGIGVGALIGGATAQERLKMLAPAMPWELPDIAALMATGAPLVRVGTPIAASVLWTVLFVVGALWRFRRDEF